MLKLKDFNFSDKRVLIRVDYNVPIKKGIIADDARIKKTLPTIKHILEKNAKQIILVSHLGRPDGKYSEDYSLKPVARRLSELMNSEVILTQPNVREISIPNNKIVMLENIRFDLGDETNDDNLAKKLASFADVFVFDAFAPYRKADVPASKTNTGAQKCVIQRVKNSSGVVSARVVGSEYHVPKPKYMRTWSNAMITITSPRRRSMETIRLLGMFKL